MQKVWPAALMLLFSPVTPAQEAEGILGQDGNNVVLVNNTGLKIVRVRIGEQVYEDIGNKTDKILVNVSPRKHHMELFFRGGAHVAWRNFDFSNCAQVTFELAGNRISAYSQ